MPWGTKKRCSFSSFTRVHSKRFNFKERYELFVETNGAIRYMRVSVESGSTVFAQLNSSNRAVAI